MTVRVLVLDGETRAALAVVRSLGEKGANMIVASPKKRAIAKASKFAALTLEHPSQTEHPDDFAKWLRQTVSQMRPNVLMPMTDTSLELTLENEEEIRRKTVLPFVSRNTFQTVSNKWELGQVAKELGIPFPESVYIEPALHRPEETLQRIRAFSYPGVLKPARSSTRLLQEVKRKGVEYVNNADEVFRVIGADEELAFLLQEKIEGVGVGAFMICVNGEVLTSFAHRRILEKPPSGGVSVLSESLSPEQAPLKLAQELLEKLRWNGVAMVEFKQRDDGKCYLMEINPRFWGSLQLAIDCGRDFPSLLLALSACTTQGGLEDLKERCRNLPPYELHRRLRWILGTVDHAMTRVKREKLRAIKDIVSGNALQLRKKGVLTRYDTYRRNDTQPFWVELEEWFARRGP